MKRSFFFLLLFFWFILNWTISSVSSSNITSSSFVSRTCWIIGWRCWNIHWAIIISMSRRTTNTWLISTSSWINWVSRRSSYLISRWSWASICRRCWWIWWTKTVIVWSGRRICWTVCLIIPCWRITCWLLASWLGRTIIRTLLRISSYCSWINWTTSHIAISWASCNTCWWIIRTLLCLCWTLSNTMICRLINRRLICLVNGRLIGFVSRWCHSIIWTLIRKRSLVLWRTYYIRARRESTFASWSICLTVLRHATINWTRCHSYYRSHSSWIHFFLLNRCESSFKHFFFLFSLCMFL